MTRTLQERPGLPGSARNDPPPEPVGFLSAYPGYRSTALLDNRERVIGASAKLADARLRGCATAGHPSSSPADLRRAASPDWSASRCGAPPLSPRVEVIPLRGTEKSPVNLHNSPSGTIRACRRRRLMYAHKDQDSTSTLTPSLPSNQSRAAAFARDSRHSGQVARAVRGAQLLKPRWLVAHPTADGATSRLRGREMSIMAAIRQTTAARGSHSVSTSAKRVGPGPGDPGWTLGRRPAESYRNEQLQPATQVRVRGSQIEVDRVQS